MMPRGEIRDDVASCHGECPQRGQDALRTLEPVDRVTRRPMVSDDVLHVLRSVCGVWGLADARTARECARMEAAW